MTSHDLLLDATKKLQKVFIPTARLDALVLLEDTLQTDRTHILAYPDVLVTDEQVKVFDAAVARRENHEPLAYIRGHVEFYGRRFRVNQHVLVPRPETEVIIDILKKLGLPDKTKIADIGTGSGCIGITLSLELPKTSIYLYDLDVSALEVTKENAILLNADVSIEESNLLDNVTDVDIIVTNLPYVPEKYAVNDEVHFEPQHAVFSGEDGMELYRLFWSQINAKVNKPRIILTESLPREHAIQTAIALKYGYELKQTDDFIQMFTARFS